MVFLHNWIKYYTINYYRAVFSFWKVIFDSLGQEANVHLVKRPPPSLTWLDYSPEIHLVVGTYVSQHTAKAAKKVIS